ncbi:hypothetical protein P2318_29160 [Myxococcaceae bacterium GXIMD 01537]
MNRKLALLATLAPLALASAQSETPVTYVFTAVDGIELVGDKYGVSPVVRVTGLIQGEQAPRTVEVWYYPVA